MIEILSNLVNLRRLEVKKSTFDIYYDYRRLSVPTT